MSPAAATGRCRAGRRDVHCSSAESTRVPMKPNRASRAKLEDALWLLSWSTPWPEICGRLSTTPAALERLMYRHGLGSLLAGVVR